MSAGRGGQGYSGDLLKALGGVVVQGREMMCQCPRATTFMRCRTLQVPAQSRSRDRAICGSSRIESLWQNSWAAEKVLQSSASMKSAEPMAVPRTFRPLLLG